MEVNRELILVEYTYDSHEDNAQPVNDLACSNLLLSDRHVKRLSRCAMLRALSIYENPTLS
jgi:hypothetical protein